MAKTYVQNANQDRNEHRLFQRDWSTEAVTGLICEEMERQGVSRADLARRLGVSASAVTQVLDKDNNHTIHSLSDVFFELGQSLEFYCRPLAEVTDKTPEKIGEIINLTFTTEIEIIASNTPEYYLPPWATINRQFLNYGQES